MKKLIVFLIVLLFGWSLAGQTTTQDVEAKTDVYLGYAFTRFNAATFVPAFSANGGIGQLQYHVTPMLGIIADLGGTHTATSPASKSIRPRSPICLVRASTCIRRVRSSRIFRLPLAEPETAEAFPSLAGLLQK